MAGLPKSIIKKYGISKKAWRVYRSRRKPRHNPNPKTRSVRRRGNRSMARKKRRRGGKSMTRTVFKLLRIGALAGPGVAKVMEPGTWDEKLDRVLRVYTGYSVKSGSFNAQELAMGWTPFLMTTLITWGVQKVGGIIRRI